MISKSKILLASTALVAVASTASAAPTIDYSSDSATVSTGALDISDAANDDTVVVSADNVTVNVTGAITNQNTEDGHDAIVVTGGATTTNINVAASVGTNSATPVAIDATAAAGVTTINVNATSTFTGDILTGSGNDAFTSSTGTNVLTGDLNLGTGTDTATITAGSLNVTGDIDGVETINVNGGTLDLDGQITGATTVSVAGTATLDMATGQSITATDLNLAAASIFTTAGTVTVNSNVTAGAGATVGAFTVGASGHTVTSNGANLTALTGGAGTDTLVSTGTSSISGNVASFDAINVTSGTLDANGSLTATTTTVSTAATLDMATGQTLTGDLVLNGTAALVATGTVTVDGDITASATSTLGNVTMGASANTVTLASGATTGTIIGTGANDDVDLTGAHNMSDLALTGMRNLSTAGALTLDGTTVIANAAIATLTVGSAGSLVTNGNTVDADIDLSAAGSTVTGALALGATGHTITTNGQTLASVAGGAGTDVFAAAAGVTTVTGDLSAMETTTVTGDLVVGGTTAPTTGLLVGGAFTSDAVTATDATVNADATATFGGTSAAQNLTVAGDLTIATGTTTISGGTAITDITGDVTIAAVNAGTGAHLVAGTLADIATKQANITLELDTDFAASGKLTTTSALDFGTTKVGLTSARGATVVGTYENIVKGASAVALTADNNVTSNALYTYTWTKDANDYDLAVALKTAGVTTLEGASSTGFKALAAQLENAGAGTSTNTADLYKAVFAQADTEKALESISSDVSGGLSQAMINSVQGTSKSIDGRLSSLRGHSGVAAGDMYSNGSMWVKAFGTTATQDAQTGSAGYDGETFGVTYGVDSDNIVEGATVGLAVSYADSNVDTAAGSDTDITSYQITGYGSKDLGDRTYVDAQVGIAYNDYESTRTSLGETYNGDFDGFQGMASIEAGRSYDWKGATVTPRAGLQYIMNTTDKYTETGTGLNALSVDNEDTSALYARVGADVAWDLSTESGVQYSPFLKAGLSYDLIGDEAESRSSFATGNAFTVKGAEAEEFAVELGAGIEVFSTNGVDVTLGYDAVLKDNYDAHTGSVKARWAF